mgnify:FL=1
MKYLEIEFSIDCNTNVAEDVRALLADAAGEAGCESFEDTPNGLRAYVQTDLWNENAMKEAINDFPIANVNIQNSVSDADDIDWNKEWE